MRLIDADAFYYTILNKTKFYDNQDRDIVLDVIDEQPTVTDTNVGCNWIPVSERLPRNDNNVLVCTEDSQVMIGWLEEENYWWLCPEFADDFAEVIAWMPLPKPYKESDNE